MGHIEPNVVRLFNSESMSLTDLLDHPNLFDNATQIFVSELNRLRTSWTDSPNWPHDRFVRRAHTLIKKTYGDKKDKSSDLLFHHPLNVADDAYRLCRLFGFDEKDATTVWIAGLCHDYIEDGKTEFERRACMTTIHGHFDGHDRDVLNLVYMLSNLDKTRSYFGYVQEIGKKSGFTKDSTERAQIAALILKLCDSRHNSRDDRNKFIALEQAKAERDIRSPDEDKRTKAQETLGWVEKKRTKIGMYHMNIGLMTAKLKGLLGAQDGLPIHATMVDFLLTDDGIPFRISNYARSRQIGLGVEENARFERLIQEQDRQNGHELLVDDRLAANTNTPHPMRRASDRPQPHAA